MKKHKLQFQYIWHIIFSIAIFITQSFAATYYVSSSGSDSNNGTSTSTPWKTITKVNSFTFSSGDAIYFQCGNQFQGQITINQSNVTLGSYGSGNKPVINGAIQLTGWSVYSGSIYVAQASSTVKNLYANGVQMTLARFPNTGFLSISSKSSTTTFSSSGITQSSGYWNGANCRLRTNAWTFESPTVSTQSGNTIVLTAAPHFDTWSTNWGFYLDNKLAALDVQNEWYCDPSTNKVYFYAPGGVNPSTLNVLGSINDYGVYSAASYITVNGLEFDYQVKGGMYFSSSTGHISIQSNTVNGGLVDGIYTTGSYCTINNNLVQNVNGNGIKTYGPNSVISNNTIKAIGLVQGYQSSAQAYGILELATYTNIYNNYLDSIGYDGIYASSYDVVQQNFVKNSMLSLSDGGGIYTCYGNSNVTIQNNVVINVPGNNQGTALWGGSYQSWTDAMGIYLDYGSASCVVRENTIIDAKSNAFMVNYGTHNHTITRNTAYNCASNAGGYFIHMGIDPSYSDGSHVITKNIFYPASNVQTIAQFQVYTSSFLSPGRLDSNYYLNTHGSTTPFEAMLNKSGWASTKYTFAGWQSMTGQEAHSSYIIPPSGKRDTIIVNATASPMTVYLPSGSIYDLDNVSYSGSFTLPAFSSKVLIMDNSVVIPALSVNPASQSFGNVTVNSVSGEQTCSVQGSNLSPASGNITITAPTGYQISLSSGTGFNSSLSISYSSSTLSSKTIYTRFAPTAAQSYTGNISFAGGGAATKNISVNGTGISAPTPTLTVNQTSLAFGDVVVNSTSSEKTFTLTGTNLSPAADSITVTASTGFAISTTSGSGYTSSKKIAYTGGALSSRTIYVLFSPASSSGYSGNITCSGGGSASKTIALTGNGVSSPTPTLTLTPSLIAFGGITVNTTSGERTYSLSGVNLSPAADSLTITAPAGFTISTVSGSNFSSSKRIAYSGGTLPAKTIYVRFSPTAVQTYSGFISNTGGGAAAQNDTVNGTGITATTPSMTVNPASIAFGDVVINTYSTERAFTLAGTDLAPVNDSITVSASNGFSISAVSGSGYSSVIRIGYSGGILSAKTIYVRFAPTSVSGFSGTISCNGGGAEIKSVSLTGVGVAATVPVLTISPESLSFGDVIINNISAEKSFSVQGTYLSPANDSLTITAPAGFSISTTSGYGFASSKRFGYTGGTLAAKTIFVRFSPAAIQSYSGSITISGGGATSKNVTATGNGANIPSPALTVNNASISFGSVRINTTSSEWSYTLQGSYLTPASGNIAITPPLGYQVSIVSGSGFSSALSIPYNGGTLSATTIFVRFAPVTVSDYNGNIVNTGGGALQNVSLNGTGIPATSAAIAASPVSLSFGKVYVNTASNEISFGLSGLNLYPSNDSLTISAPPGFTISTMSGSGFVSTKKIAYTNGMLQPIPKIIYVKFSPTDLRTYSDSIVISGGTAAMAAVHVSGTGLSNIPAPTGTFISSVDTLAIRGNVTLTWTSTNATEASLDNGIGSVSVNGYVTVYIRSTTKFILTLSNINGTTTYTKTVYVRPRKLTQNKALFKPSMASSYEYNGQEPAKANDGNIKTSWSSAYVDNQWWQVDLQDITTIQDISLIWDKSYASEFTISASLDGVIFNDVATGYSSGSDTTEVNIDPINTRFIRLTGIQRGTEYGISLIELSAFDEVTTPTTGVTNSETPRTFSLEQNYPNPFNPSTTIGYQLSAAAEVQLIVYDMLGKEITTLVNQVQQAGHHTVTFNAKNLASGIYYAKLAAEGKVQIKKMTLIK